MHSLPGPDSMAPALSSEQRGFAMQLRVSKKNILILALAFLQDTTLFSFAGFAVRTVFFVFVFAKIAFVFLLLWYKQRLMPG